MRILLLPLALFLFFGCVGVQDDDGANAVNSDAGRLGKIPKDAVKMGPWNDATPPVMHSEEWEKPVPLEGPINTAGAEDSPFIMPNGNTLYFFFTPDVRVPVERQVLDGITGVYVSHKADGEWSEPYRVVLQDAGKVSLDGCVFVQGDMMLFCSAREGYTGVNWFTAKYERGGWQDWRPAGFSPEYEVGELHITANGNELYFHSPRAGGKGGLDIWVSERIGGEWGEPVNVAEVNCERDDGWPFISADGKGMWISRDYGLWRSVRKDGKWGEPELIVSGLAGEAALDDDGNLYFVHHYFKEGVMVEADIYVAYKK